VSYSDCIIGAAIFDLSGLPKEYLTTLESADIGWVQTSFQALGLQSLLTSSLRLEGFHHALIHSADYCTVVVKQKSRYMALLTRPSALRNPEPFIQWVQELEPAALRSHPRFCVI
jgi:hypothetical protein